MDGKGLFFMVLQADVSTAALVIIKYAAGMQRCTGGGFGGGVYFHITPPGVLHTFVPVTQFQRSLLGKVTGVALFLGPNAAQARPPDHLDMFRADR